MPKFCSDGAGIWDDAQKSVLSGNEMANLLPNEA